MNLQNQFSGDRIARTVQPHRNSLYYVLEGSLVENKKCFFLIPHPLHIRKIEEKNNIFYTIFVISEADIPQVLNIARNLEVTHKKYSLTY